MLFGILNTRAYFWVLQRGVWMGNSILCLQVSKCNGELSWHETILVHSFIQNGKPDQLWSLIQVGPTWKNSFLWSCHLPMVSFYQSSFWQDQTCFNRWSSLWSQYSAVVLLPSYWLNRISQQYLSTEEWNRRKGEAMSWCPLCLFLLMATVSNIVVLWW